MPRVVPADLVIGRVAQMGAQGVNVDLTPETSKPGDWVDLVEPGTGSVARIVVEVLQVGVCVQIRRRLDGRRKRGPATSDRAARRNAGEIAIVHRQVKARSIGRSLDRRIGR